MSVEKTICIEIAFESNNTVIDILFHEMNTVNYIVDTENSCRPILLKPQHEWDNGAAAK